MDQIAEQLASRLEANPNDLQAYEALKAHYLRTQDLASLTNLIAGWAGYQSDPYQASRGYYEASQVVAKAEPEHERRLALLRQAVSLDPNYREALADLIGVLPRMRDAQTLAGFLEEHLQTLETVAGDKTLMTTLYEQLAGVWVDHLHQPAAARHCYERMLDLTPTQQAIDRARAFAQTRDDWKLLAIALGAEATLAADSARKSELYRAQARALTHDSPDWDRAVEALQNAHTLSPHDLAIAQELADTYVRRAESSTSHEAAADRRRAADLRCHVAQTLAAADALPLLQAALRTQPDHEGALQLLEQLAARLGQEALLPPFWLAYMAHTSPGPELDRRRIAMAGVYERAGKLDEAIQCLEQLHDPASAAALLGALTELKVRHGTRTQTRKTSSSLKPLPEGPISRGGWRGSNEHHAHEDGMLKPDRRLDAEPALREQKRRLRNAIAAHRPAEIIEQCREVIQQQPNDLTAFTLLESHYRRAKDYERLIELLRESAKSSELSATERRLRLREVAWLTERKLRDSDAAIGAWRSVLDVEPRDEEAVQSLKRLLRSTQQWNDLARIVEHEAASTDNVATRASLLAQLAEVQRDQLDDPYRAADTLRQLSSLRPDENTRRELCEALLHTQAYGDAVVLLRQQVDEARGERERLDLLRQLADILDTQLHELEAAFEVCSQILSLRPNDTDTLARMQRIDERTGNAQRLLSTLARRCELIPRKARANLYIEMAQIAETAGHDSEAAGRYYRAAYELDPAQLTTLDALCAVFERRELYARLVELLSQMRDATRDPARRVELGLRRARLLAGPMNAAAEAADAYRTVLQHEENVEAVQYLLDMAREHHEADTTAGLCARLAALLEDRAQCRALLYERAQLLVTELGRPRDAIVTLRNIVEEVEPEYEPAVEWLAELAGNLGDSAGVASALARRLDKSTTADATIALARRLADLHEHELDDRQGAIAALLRWAESDPSDPLPQRRLRRLLEEAGRYEELVATCDALAQLETEDSARDDATLRAAQVAANHLRAPDAAWHRLTPLVCQGQPKAIELLTTIARHTRRFEDLAALYVRAAQDTERPELQKELWSLATRVYRDELSQPDQALDAALRLLGSDLRDRDALAQVEESVTQSGQWPRLSSVYDRLIKTAAHDGERTELLVRYADLLERRAGNPNEALNVVLQACALSPDDEQLLAKAEALAVSCDRSADLLSLCDRQAATANDPSIQVEWLLRGARFANSTADDRDATYAYLETALAAARTDGQLWERCVALAQRLDAAAPDAEHHSHLLALVAAHRRVAERSPAAVGVSLMRRASRLIQDKLGDERAAFDLLRTGAALFPLDDNMYDALREHAEAAGHLDALDAHLARGVDEALDPRTAASLLSRRARLLEGPLGRPDDAANVYQKLLQLRPDDQLAASKLRESLRRARRFQDLLVVIHKQTLRAKQPAEKLELLKETAHVWELDLRNRWEAADAWAKALELAPNDAEALRAVARLDRRSGAPAAPRPQPRSQVPLASSSSDTAARIASSPPKQADATVEAQQQGDEILEEVASVELLPIDDDQDMEPVRTVPPQRSAPPAPPPQAFLSGRPRQRTSAPPPPPPPKTRSS